MIVPLLGALARESEQPSLELATEFNPLGENLADSSHGLRGLLLPRPLCGLPGALGMAETLHGRHRLLELCRRQFLQELGEALSVLGCTAWGAARTQLDSALRIYTIISLSGLMMSLFSARGSMANQLITLTWFL